MAADMPHGDCIRNVTTMKTQVISLFGFISAIF